LKSLSISSSKALRLIRSSDTLRFALKGFGFIALGFCIWIGLAVGANYLDRGPHSILELRVSDLLTGHSDVEAIVVGHSHAGALDFSALGIHGYHVWAGGSDVFEVEYELRSLVPQLKNLRTVFMPMAYWGFAVDNSAHPERRVRNLDYYRAFGNGPITSSDRWLYLRSRAWNIVRSDHWKSIVEALLGDRRDRALPPAIDHVDGHSIQGSDFKPPAYGELVEYAKKRVAQYLEIQDTCEVRHPNLTQDTYACVERIIRFLQTKGIRIVFFTPPYFVTYTELYCTETIRSMRARMQQLVANYDVEYYDFSTDEEFIYNNLLFRNPDHLNADGATVFSKKLRAAMYTHEAVGEP